MPGIDPATGQLLPSPVTDLAPQAHWLLADILCDKTEDYTAVWEIQGDGPESPFDGQSLDDVRGVVTGDFQRGSGGPSELRGFFIQAHETDCNPATSDGVFVFTGWTARDVTVGDVVELNGVGVTEYAGPFFSPGPRTLTELTCYSGCTIEIVRTGLGLPAAVDVDPPADPDDYFETIEGMVGEIRDTATVVGPTNRFNEAVVVRGAGSERITGDEAGRIVIDGDAVDAARCGADGLPDAQVFDEFTYDLLGDGLRGIVTYTFSADKLHLDPARGCPAVVAGDHSSYDPAANPPPRGDEPTLTIASMNAENFFLRTADEKSPKLAAAICDPDGLATPDVIGLQEIQNDDVLALLAADVKALCGVEYAHASRSSADPRGIENGYMVRTDQATLVSTELHQGCSDTYRGVRRAGDSDVTCGGATPYFLHNRPPLEAVIQTAAGDTVHLLNVHFKSKLSSHNCVDPDCTDFRVAEAHHVVELVEARLAAGNTHVAVLGDFNDGPGTETMDVLAAAGLVNLWDDLPGAPSDEQGQMQQYSHIFRGESSALDHILVSSDLDAAPREFSPRHTNADWPESLKTAAGMYRFSDHDTIIAAFDLG